MAEAPNINGPQDAYMQQLRRGLRIGLQAVQDTLHSHGVQVDMPDGAWFDIRPMLDPREQSTEAIDKVVEVLSYGESVGLLRRHHDHRHLLRVVEA
jgi:hypothetical protein